MSPQEYFPEPSSLPFTAADEEGAGFALTPERTRERYWLYILLFLTTLLTTTVVGAAMQQDFDHNRPFDVQRGIEYFAAFWHDPGALLHGLPFSLTLLTILLAHELGHYLACVYYHIDASLPYFLPAPTITGTFGAFIRIRSAIYSKRQLFDIGVAGPLAGFVFLLPALAVGLAFSKVLPGIGHQGAIHFGVPGLEWLLERTIFPGVRTEDLYLHPVARAAWIGMLATALNLLPIGQLDGGHVLYALMSDRHKLISRAAIAALIPLGIFYWWVWILWAVVLFWLGRYHPLIYDDSDVGAGRRRLGLVALVIFLLCFTVAPVETMGL